MSQAEYEAFVQEYNEWFDHHFSVESDEEV